MHCGITDGTATKNNKRVWSCLLWNNQRVWFACCEITFSSASCWDNGAWRERLLLDWFGWCWRCFTGCAHCPLSSSSKGSKWIPAGPNQIRASEDQMQSVRFTNMFTLSTHFSATSSCPFLRPQLMTSLFVQHPPPPPPHRHLIWTGHFYMWWHTSWQNGEGGKKSHSCAPFCPVINSPDFFLPNL